MISLEKIFLCQARSLNDKINAVQLRKLLKKEDGTYFDQKLVSELAHSFGNGGLVTIDGFGNIWKLLQKLKQQFDKLSHGSFVLTQEAFQWALENAAAQKITPSFCEQIMGFYNYEISFDVFVHSRHHIRKISSRLDFTVDGCNLMKNFKRSVSTARAATNQIDEEIITQEIEIKRITCQRLLISYS